MARLLLIPDNEESMVAPALVLKATDYWPRIFLHAIWRELQAGDNQGRRLLRVTYAGLDLVYMYEYPAGERQVTQEDFYFGTSAEAAPRYPRRAAVSGAALCVHVICREFETPV